MTDNDGLTGTTTGAALEIIDNIPPTTVLEIGEPKYVDPLDYIYVTSDTPFTMVA